MMLNGQNDRISDCRTAAVIDAALGCVGLWSAVSFFLPGSDHSVRDLVFGAVVTVYFFYLVYLNLARAASLKADADAPRRPRRPTPTWFYTSCALLDVLLAWMAVEPAVRAALAAPAGGIWGLFPTFLIRGALCALFLWCAWGNLRLGLRRSSGLH